MSGTTGSTSEGQGIFISYRRSDCQPQANGLHDGLTNRLDNARIFMDIDSIPAGVYFEEHIRNAINECDVALVLIGDNWLDRRPGTETRRIDEPNDFVRLEVESALGNPNVTTIPVLVEGAQMPEAATLPESIRKLASINAFELDDKRWKSDLARITDLLKSLHQKKSTPPPPAAAPQPSSQPQPSPRSPQQPPEWRPSSQPPPTAPFSAPQRQYPTPAPQQQAYGATPSAQPAQQAQWQPQQSVPGVKRSNGMAVGVLAALAPLLCCGLLNFVPLLRAGLSRPAHRWQLIGTGIALEVAAIAGFVLFGGAPTDADDTPQGVAANAGMALILLSAVIAVVLGFVFLKNPEDER